MSALALERAVLTSESFASNFVRAIRTVAVVVAPIAARNAFLVRDASEFRCGAFTVLMAAEFVIFVITVGAIVFEIASPATRNATLVLALEFGRLMAFGTLFRQLVRAVATVVFSVAEEPLRNTTVIAPARTTSPSGRAVALPTNVGRLVRSVSAVVVRVAVPRFLDAASVLAREFRFRIARSRVTNGRIFIRSIAAVVVPVAFPSAQDTTAGRITFEFVLRARNIAVTFVRSISAIIDSVAKGRGRRAVVVVALELAGFAETLLARAGLVRSVLAILFSVAFPVERNTTIVFSSATMLSY